ncbi:MAG: flavodoxin [Blautia sp.]|nr:flavodoxin [Blautia sp.]
MSKTLVAYFSATGRTKILASTLASVVKGELFEIIPKQPYSVADLNWQEKTSRSSVEMEDRASRPEIALTVENMDQYDTVFVGFPIWWYREPSIIDTFMESYDFSGKTVIPFATSGGSRMGDSSKNLQELAPGAKVEEGKRMLAGSSVDEIESWAQKWM